MDKAQILETAKTKTGQLISLCMGYLDAIHYFEDIKLHNKLDNSTLKELCKVDLKGIRNDTITTRPCNIQDEIVLGRIYETDENELLSLFEKKFEKAKHLDGFKTKKAFAKYEYKYQKGIWKNHDITKWIPIAKQWLNLLKGIEAAEPEKVANGGNKELKDFFKTGTNNELIEEIKNEFNPIKPKETAILIYLLHKEFNLINLSGTKFKGRNRISEILLNKEIRNNTAVNKYFKANTDNIDIHTKTDDNYKDINNRLLKIINKFNQKQ
ncbi:hypothetical protein DFQ09_105195 [Winogradskyella pacifica]|uniref:Uncharacterized protein n=1 Tax=Winogradskyella pacifica TaxID=664642 RepID=A0A3D9MAY5_9FLAO|nr:hypothetical protein [Winogradskyella pacifica]REE16982.1 hypothetical protein DFQ09_105195 [Winogradskyella pacifica]